MKRQKKQLITMAVFLAFLIIAYIGLGVYNDAQEQKEEDENKIVVTNFDSEDVVAFSYDYNGETYSYTKIDGMWSYDSKPAINLDETLVESMLVIAASLVGEDFFTAYESVDTYGFDEPQKTVSLIMSDGSTVTIQVGDYNDIVGWYYLMIEGDENLYMVDSTLLDTFEVSYTSLEYVEEATEEIEGTEEVESTE